MEIITDVPIQIETYISRIDGAVVVQVDTGPDLGAVRINLNDGPVWYGDPEGKESSADLITLCKYLEEVFIPELLAAPWYHPTVDSAIHRLRQEFPRLLADDETP